MCVYIYIYIYIYVSIYLSLSLSIYIYIYIYITSPATGLPLQDTSHVAAAPYIGLQEGGVPKPLESKNSWSHGLTTTLRDSMLVAPTLNDNEQVSTLVPAPSAQVPCNTQHVTNRRQLPTRYTPSIVYTSYIYIYIHTYIIEVVDIWYTSVYLSLSTYIYIYMYSI